MKKWITWGIIIVLVVGGGFFIWRFQRTRALISAAKNAAQNLSTATAQRRDLEVIVTGKGTIQADLRKDLQPGVSGTVSQVLVDEGDRVSQGTPLVRLSNEAVEYEAEKARLDLALAEQELARLTGPAGSKAKAELSLRQAELDLTAAREDLDNLSIESPIGGDLWDIAVKAGDSVKAGQVVATVADTSEYYVTGRLRQADYRKVSTGLKVTVKPGGDMKPVSGRIESIASEGVSGSKGIEFPVEISISDPGPHLRAGMSVQVDCHLKNGALVSMSGTVEAKDRREVTAEVDGTVARVLAAEGEIIERGQLILILENSSVMVAYDKAENDVESARQSLASYQNDIDEQRLKVEQARITADDKARAAAKLTGKSPIDGKVVSISVDEGDDVSANDVLIQIASDSLTVVIPVDELDVTNVAVGQAAKVEVDAFPGRVFDGTVAKIAQEGTVQQGITNYDVTVEVRSDEPMLGMSATATIAVAAKAGVLTVPVEAVTWQEDQAYVYKIEGGLPVQTRVAIGVQGDLYAEVASGLSEGDTVIVGGLPSSGGMGGLMMLRPGGTPGVRVGSPR